eukprot:CAMPEP_0170479054 /NCGR_PEP_ID=MMETSP0208-20121228/425_1 /TAXON_ID=197538 /ORGANISM="Strombidium inclinatum, Strain S3" /LENGTH=50 /DNA_ID=CAMNT_0010751395 /DNA_START=20 /DNA_END=169 /DNA_ORIENTATION=-
MKSAVIATLVASTSAITLQQLEQLRAAPANASGLAAPANATAFAAPANAS